jgi:hypothetical protein
MPTPRPKGGRTATVRLGDVNAQPNPTASYALAPLSWVAEEDLLYDPESRTLHRPGCLLARRSHSSRPVPAGSVLTLVWAARMCECGPDVTLALSRS